MEIYEEFIIGKYIQHEFLATAIGIIETKSPITSILFGKKYKVDQFSKFLKIHKIIKITNDCFK